MNYNKDIIIFDLETPKKCFLASFYIVEKKEYIDFLINSDRNDLFKLTKFLSDNKNKYFVGYNNINFDNQIIEEINRNIDYLSSLSNLELSEYICNYASSLIELSNHNSRLPYSEENFSFKVIDLPRIWHFFNENRRTSLKVLEYEMRAETIETFEFDINQDFKEEDIEKLIYYCHNDIKYTYEHFKYTVGDTNHILYRGEDKIQDRLDIIEETGYKCLNWDDVKIGSESNKSEYLRITQRDEKDLKPKRINFAYGKCFKEFFPKTVKFNTPNLKKFINELGNERIKKNIKNKKQEFKFRFNNELVSTIAKGGIHSNDKPRFIKPEEDEIYLQIDIGGQYPNAMVKYKAFPKHLGLPWNKVIESNIIKRDFHKKEYKLTKNRKHNSIQKMLKLSNNGGS